MHGRWLLPVLLVSPVLAQTVDPEQVEPEEVFRALDTDGNGLLSPREAEIMPGLALHWQRLDRDNSGSVSLAELRELDPPPPVGTEGLDFAVIDADNDGRISRQESSTFLPLSNNWSAVDQNGDGSVDRSEFAAFEYELFNGASIPPGEQQPPPTASRADFDSLDRNSDGRLSREEVAPDIGLLSGWEQLDEDGDNYLSRSEFAPFEPSKADGANPENGEP